MWAGLDPEKRILIGTSEVTAIDSGLGILMASGNGIRRGIRSLREMVVETVTVRLPHYGYTTARVNVCDYATYLYSSHLPRLDGLVTLESPNSCARGWHRVGFPRLQHLENRISGSFRRWSCVVSKGALDLALSVLYP